MSKKENFPDVNGFFGEYGGKFVPETLMFALPTSIQMVMAADF